MESRAAQRTKNTPPRRKMVNIAFTVLFLLMLALPTVFINVKPNQVSDIDNRMLTEWMDLQGPDLASLTAFGKNVSKYYYDRFGFREEMITANQVLNDRIFGLLVHPTYVYGKDRYVYAGFGRATSVDRGFVDAYTDYIKQMQDYCRERGADFLYALNPSKSMLYPEYLPNGVHYSFDYYHFLFQEAVRKGVNAVDLSVPLLSVKNEKGLPVFNQKYDARHWNMHGAFYGVSAIMEKLSENNPTLSPLDESDFTLYYQTETTLPVSHFAIREETPHYSPKQLHSVIVNDLDAEIRMGDLYPEFTQYINPANPTAPKILVFHGSHINQEVKRYIVDQFSEAAFIRSYHTITDLPYYFNLFQPDIVVYEVVDWTIHDQFISIPTILDIDLQPALATFRDLPETGRFTVSPDSGADGNGANAALKRLSYRVSGGDLACAYLKIGEKVYDFEIDCGNGQCLIAVELPKKQLAGIAEAEVILIPAAKDGKQTIRMDI